MEGAPWNWEERHLLRVWDDLAVLLGSCLRGRGRGAQRLAVAPSCFNPCSVFCSLSWLPVHCQVHFEYWVHLQSPLSFLSRVWFSWTLALIPWFIFSSLCFYSLYFVHVSGDHMWKVFQFWKKHWVRFYKLRTSVFVRTYCKAEWKVSAWWQQVSDTISWHCSTFTFPVEGSPFLLTSGVIVLGLSTVTWNCIRLFFAFLS